MLSGAAGRVQSELVRLESALDQAALDQDSLAYERIWDEYTAAMSRLHRIECAAHRAVSRERV